MVGCLKHKQSNETGHRATERVKRHAGSQGKFFQLKGKSRRKLSLESPYIPQDWGLVMGASPEKSHPPETRNLIF